MAYFIAGYGTDTVKYEALVDASTSILTNPGDKRRRDFGAGAVRATSWEIEKTLSDIVIKDSGRDAWMVITGTPILNKSACGDHGSPLAFFLEDPDRFLCTALDGTYALIVHDGRSGVFHCATDFNRLTPIYVAAGPDGVLISSSELALARSVSAGIDPVGMAQAVSLGTVWGDRTRFQGIFKMAPAERLTVGADLRVDRRPYWRPEEEPEWDPDFPALVSRWGRLWEETIAKYGEGAGDDPFYADLTAGEDSRLVVAQCHALGLPFTARVWGMDGDTDTTVAMEASRKLGFPIFRRTQRFIDDEMLIENAMDICTLSDCYEPFFKACMRYAMNDVPNIPDSAICLGGVPGGGAFRGAYYLRAKLLKPNGRGHLDTDFFIRMKFLLDYAPELISIDDREFRESVFDVVNAALAEVEGFTDGIRADHLVRVLQTSMMGLMYKHPMYQPFAAPALTRSLYSISPSYKSGGRMTKALTGRLYPELARIRTQNGVPTVERNFRNSLLFLPEYLSVFKKVVRGVKTRILRINLADKSLPYHMRHDCNRKVFQTLTSHEPYRTWFSAPEAMATGSCYNSDELARLLAQAREGSFRNLNLLARLISQEFAIRWVRGDVS